jgi:hypothetical protein
MVTRRSIRAAGSLVWRNTGQSAVLNLLPYPFDLSVQPITAALQPIKGDNMKIIAAVLLSAGLFAASAVAGHAQTQTNPIPGIDVVVKKKPAGNAVKVGDCQKGGGKVVQQGGEWVCTGMKDAKPAKQSAATNAKPKKPVAQNTAGNGIGSTDVGLDDMDGKRLKATNAKPKPGTPAKPAPAR